MNENWVEVKPHIFAEIVTLSNKFQFRRLHAENGWVIIDDQEEPNYTYALIIETPLNSDLSHLSAIERTSDMEILGKPTDEPEIM